MTRFVTIAGPDSGEFSGKPVMLGSDVREWVAAGRPPLSGRQLGALCRTLAYNTGQGPEAVVQLGKATRAAFLLSQPPATPASPSHIPNGPASSRPTKSGRTAGNGPRAKTKMQTASKLRKRARRQLKQIRRHLLARGADPAEVKVMCQPGTDPELTKLWLGQMAPVPSRTASVHPDEAAIMLGAAPELRAIWLAQSAAPGAAPALARRPLGMDAERYQLHQDAKQLAADRMRVDPRLTEAAAYSSAVIMLAEQRDPSSPI
jgi:hypothetical protein